MTDMIERVARAICRAGGKDPDETMIELGGVRTPMWDAFVPIARAVIEAMREPSAESNTNALYRKGLGW